MGISKLFRDEELEKAFLSKFDKIKESLDQSLSNQSTLHAEILNLRSLVDNMIRIISSMDQRISAMQSKIDEMQAPKGNYTTGTDNVGGYQQQRTPQQPRREEPKPSTRTFYAMSLVGDENVLHEVGENKKANVPFIVTVNGDKGEAKFNPEYVPYALKSVESRLIPFFEYDIQANPPSIVIPVNTVPVRLSDNKWVMENRIKIILQ